jgi:hypothetical protein
MLGYAVFKPKESCDIYTCRKKAKWRIDYFSLITPDYYCDEHKPKVVKI